MPKRITISQSTLDEMQAVSDHMNAEREWWDNFYVCMNESLQYDGSFANRLWWQVAEARAKETHQIPCGYGSY